jgi:hypothetical protein
MTEIFENTIAWVRLNWILVLFLTVVVGAFIFLRTENSNIEDSDELATILYNGQPVIIEFYSNY